MQERDPLQRFGAVEFDVDEEETHEATIDLEERRQIRMMASRTIIPRFLLPLQSPLWRSSARASRGPSLRGAVRYNSDKPIVLEKPLKFNPPSHGSRLRNKTMPKYYGGVVTETELAAQRQKSYPGMMAPEGTAAHFFWHSRMLHTCITLGTLIILGITTVFLHYATYSPYKDLVPPAGDLFKQPFQFFSMWWQVIVLSEQAKNLRANEERLARQNDTLKQRYYRKMHGIEEKNPIHAVFGKLDDKTEAELEAEVLGKELPEGEAGAAKGDGEAEPRKKWFGIF